MSCPLGSRDGYWVAVRPPCHMPSTLGYTQLSRRYMWRCYTQLLTCHRHRLECVARYSLYIRYILSRWVNLAAWLLRNTLFWNQLDLMKCLFT